MHPLCPTLPQTGIYFYISLGIGAQRGSNLAQQGSKGISTWLSRAYFWISGFSFGSAGLFGLSFGSAGPRRAQ